MQWRIGSRNKIYRGWKLLVRTWPTSNNSVATLGAFKHSVEVVVEKLRIVSAPVSAPRNLNTTLPGPLYAFVPVWNLFWTLDPPPINLMLKGRPLLRKMLHCIFASWAWHVIVVVFVVVVVFVCLFLFCFVCFFFFWGGVRGRSNI